MADTVTPEAVQQKFVLTWKTAMSVMTGVVALLGTFWAIDNHYASATDIDRVQHSMELNVANVQHRLEGQVRALRLERADDEIFKLQVKKESQGGKLSPEDAAMLDRFLRRSAEANREQRAADNAVKKQLVN